MKGIVKMPTFERIEEYKAVLDNLAQVSSRRQNSNDIFVGFNVVFLTGIGILLSSSHLDSWWLVGSLSIISFAIMPLNIIWRTSLLRYKNGVSIQLEYLREIENDFRTRAATKSDDDLPNIGLFLKLNEKHRPKSGNTRLEIQLATYFIVIYPLLTVLVGILTACVISKFLPVFNLN